MPSVEQQTKASYKDTYASLEENLLTIGNDHIERSWHISGRLLLPLSLTDKFSGNKWQLSKSADKYQTAANPVLKSEIKPLVTGAANALHISLSCNEDDKKSEYLFAIAPQGGFILQSAYHDQQLFLQKSCSKDKPTEAPEGIELKELMKNSTDALNICNIENWQINLNNYLLHVIKLEDTTDRSDNLYIEEERRISPPESYQGRGCLFILREPLSNTGLILLKHAPLPHARPIKQDIDIEICKDALYFCDFADGAYNQSYDWTVIPFCDGLPGSTRALQQQRNLLHPYVKGCDGLFISNTWGDRSQDGAITEEFLLKEVETASQMGIDICQIDDGWQQGTSANSVNAATAGGVWEGFHAADADFWTPNKKRLPNGLEPILAKARENKIGIGLWYAPDSAQDFTNWRKDADTILGLFKKYGVCHFKADSVKATTKLGECNLRKLFHAVSAESSGKILIDLDVTSGIRPGYFGAPEVGALFVENRYSDHPNYWPHATFRNFWQLCHILPPAIMRMEILNLTRNSQKYGNDPLTPQHYHSAYVFTTIMLSSPLMWCELSRLEARQKNELAEIIPIWKKYRHELHNGITYPIGQAPSGGSWSGFLVETDSAYHLLTFREKTSSARYCFQLPTVISATGKVENISTSGTLELDDDLAMVKQEREQTYCWWRIPR